MTLHARICAPVGLGQQPEPDQLLNFVEDNKPTLR